MTAVIEETKEHSTLCVILSRFHIGNSISIKAHIERTILIRSTLRALELTSRLLRNIQVMHRTCDCEPMLRRCYVTMFSQLISLRYRVLLKYIHLWIFLYSKADRFQQNLNYILFILDDKLSEVIYIFLVI